MADLLAPSDRGVVVYDSDAIHFIINWRQICRRAYSIADMSVIMTAFAGRSATSYLPAWGRAEEGVPTPLQVELGKGSYLHRYRYSCGTCPTYTMARSSRAGQGVQPTPLQVELYGKGSLGLGGSRQIFLQMWSL